MAFLSGITSLVTSSPTVLAVSAGVLAGAVTGTAVVASGVLSSPAPEQLALVSCPASETVVARVTSGQQMLVTAKSGDGAWLRLFIGEPGLDSGWAPASALRIADAIDGLPVAGCEVVVLPSGVAPPPATPGVTAIVDPTPTPTPLPSGVTPPPATPTPFPTPTPTPTPKPTGTPLPPGVTPTPFVATPLPPPPTIPPPTAPPPTAPPPTAPPPTPPPDLTPPAFSNFSITGAYYDGSGNYYIDNAGNGCGTPTSAWIRARVTDSGGSGLAGFTVTLHWVDPNGGGHTNQMSYGLSTGLYGYTINNQAGWAANGWIQYWITASDNAGNSSQTSSPPTNQLWLFKGQCIL